MKHYVTEVKKIFETEYVKVFLLDEKRNAEIQSVLSDLDCVKRVNITGSNSPNNPSETLTVYPKRMYDGQTLNKRIVSFLDSYFTGVVDNSEAVRNEAHFKGILDKIINALNGARVSIVVAMSWFTNDTLLEKLVQKQNEGVDVKVAIYDDGINKKHGVDLSRLKTVYKVKAERGSIMHNKFCVIDNQVVITGSYNWTNNAETRNDENVTVQYDPKSATEYTVKYNELIKPLNQSWIYS